MADGTLKPASPLLGHAKLGRSGRLQGDAGVVIREVRDFHAIHIASRHGKAAEVAGRLTAHIGSPVTDGPHRFAGNGLAVIGIAPAQWLAVERGDRCDGLIRLQNDLTGLAAVSAQGAGKIMLEISGRHARDALCKGIAVDLDPAAFKVGDSAQTVAAHVGVQISLLDDAPTFEIMSAASMAGSLWSWLSQSAREFGLLVT